MDDITGDVILCHFSIKGQQLPAEGSVSRYPSQGNDLMGTCHHSKGTLSYTTVIAVAQLVATRFCVLFTRQVWPGPLSYPYNRNRMSITHPTRKGIERVPTSKDDQPAGWGM